MWYQVALQRFLVLDFGPQPPGSTRPRFAVPLAVGFGWLLAPYYWNLLSKPYILRCRSFQMRTFLYVDDQLGGNKDKRRAQAEYHLAKATMGHFGFTPAPDKGQSVVAQAESARVKAIVKRSSGELAGQTVKPKDMPEFFAHE